MRRRLPALLATALTALMTSVALDQPALADGAERASLRAELGMEYDSNAQRAEIVDATMNPPIIGSPLGRGVLTGRLADLITPRQSIAVAATLGGKLFTNRAAQSEDVGIVSTSLQWRVFLGEEWNLSILGAYYEAFQRGESGAGAGPRQRGDFRSLAPTARLGRRLGEHVELGVSGGYRQLVFKPNPDYTFDAPTAALDLRWLTDDPDAGVDWELAAGVAYEYRRYDSSALVITNCFAMAGDMLCPLMLTQNARRDQFATGHVELTRTGAALLGLGYVLQWNQSNSYGETLQRHFLSLRLTAGLPLGLYLAARAELLVARYADRVMIGSPSTMQTNDIDRENRSSVRVDLSRALTERLQLVARYTAYLNELGSVGRYHRQTALLSLAITLDK